MNLLERNILYTKFFLFLSSASRLAIVSFRLSQPLFSVDLLTSVSGSAQDDDDDIAGSAFEDEDD